MRHALRRVAHFFKRLVHLAASPMRRDSGRGGTVVHPYRGYGSRQEAFVMGRVYRQPAPARMIPRRGALRDVADVARRMLRRGVVRVEVEVRLGDNVRRVVTDRDGYFSARISLASPLPVALSWHRADIAVKTVAEGTVRTRAEVYVPSQDTDLLVISDIDDTVMFTGVAEKLKMLYRLFMKKAERRTAFPGVAALYQALHCGASGRLERPILYVSRGPWAIYEMLEAFFQLNRIPVGPILFLREWGLSWRHPWPRRATDHKRDLIERMLALFDGVPCVLIGDSGQHDPEVYTQIVKAYPGRIAAIYIRRVDSSPERETAINRLREELVGSDCELILAADSLKMARHAHHRGFISAHGRRAVRDDVRAHPDA
ncbi:App1 family protein [Halomonas cibimaris]|uniref:App1 family protein n=1 Tax=Halomonas cibimaris TaxID=657012 RepID=A0ABP7LCC1_9GAMM